MQEPNNESYGYVMECGKIILSGTAAELSGNDRVRQAYLGG
jgi:branched-chain amino acid transport system ATP-binding protein